MKPILFNTQMVKALLDNRKTQTRRAVKSHIDINNECEFRKRLTCGDFDFGNKNYFTLVKPQYKEGDILYVRETFRPFSNITMNSQEVGIEYKADNETKVFKNEDFRYFVFYDKWKPSVHMPKEYARIFLKVTNVRVERVQDISLRDSVQEGIEHDERMMTSFEMFAELWNSTSKDGYKFENNPYVFVYEFERVEAQDE